MSPRQVTLKPKRSGATVLLAVGLTTACGGATRPAAHAATAPHSHPHPRSPAALLPDVVARSASPYFGIRHSDGARLEAHALLEELSRADAICVGERHDEPRHHFAQLEVLRRLAERAPQAGRRLAVGFEMFAAPMQKVLDDYAASRIGERELLARTDWKKSWGFDFALYRPLLELGRRAGLRLLALNAPPALTRTVARRGLEGLTAAQRGQLPELNLYDREHRIFFDEAMRGHPMADTNRNNPYAAQVVWDETMAANAARWLSRGDSARQILVLAGLGHCHESAVVRRLERRVATNAIAVRPVVEGTDSAEPEPHARFDYDIVLEPPPSSHDGES